MTYYKGKIVKLSDLEKNVIILNENRGASKFSDALIDDDKYDEFTTLLNGYKMDRVYSSGRIYDFIRKYKDNIVRYVGEGVDVIFEMIVDKSERKFGREIITGLIFPWNFIVNGYYVNFEENNRMYKDNNRIYIKKIGTIGTYFSSDEEVTINYDITPFNTYVYQIKEQIAKENEVMGDIRNIIYTRSQIASEKEIKDYLRNHSFLRKRRFLKRINEMYSQNGFKREVEEVKEAKQGPKVLERQDQLTIIMENIEYMLSILGRVDENLKAKYQNKYNEMLKSESDTSIHVTAFDYRNFISLESEIELCLSMLKRNTDNIIDYLDALKREYLENFFNESKTDITIDEIDKINELFLKSKEKYSVVDRRKILQKFSLIYLLEVLENKDEDLVDRLENSYFKMHLKSILIAVNTLIDLGLIKENIYAYLENDVNVESVLNIIRSLEIKKENAKVIEKNYKKASHFSEKKVY